MEENRTDERKTRCRMMCTRGVEAHLRARLGIENAACLPLKHFYLLAENGGKAPQILIQYLTVEKEEQMK